jgi:protein-S-isoprenylcysteine O-methyltransferase Ste14
MARDARESLVALIAVLLVFGMLFLLPTLLEDVRIPRWVQAVGLGLNLAIVIGVVIRHRRCKPARKPE